MRLVEQRNPKGPMDSPSVVAMGLFDGVHLGHKAVIGVAARTAHEKGLRLAVFTFTGDAKNAPHITTKAQKHRLLARLGVDTCYQPPFASFCALSPESFLEEMLRGEYNAHSLVCGNNFAFGAQRSGNTAQLAELAGQRGLGLIVVPMAQYKGQAVSSSRIRAALAGGDIEDANGMLGYPYELEAPVVHGKQLGGSLGFPTINQHFCPGLQTPAYGVYISQVMLNGIAYPSVTGWGERPTVNGGAPSCETFIPNFTGNLYGQNVAVRFHKRISGQRRFESVRQLADGVQAWAAQALAYFK